MWTQNNSTSVFCFWFILSGTSSKGSNFLLATKFDYDKKGTSITGHYGDYDDAWVSCGAQCQLGRSGTSLVTFSWLFGHQHQLIFTPYIPRAAMVVLIFGNIGSLDDFSTKPTSWLKSNRRNETSATFISRMQKSFMLNVMNSWQSWYSKYKVKRHTIILLLSKPILIVWHLASGMNLYQHWLMRINNIKI